MLDESGKRENKNKSKTSSGESVKYIRSSIIDRTCYIVVFCSSNTNNKCLMYDGYKILGLENKAL